MKVRKIISLIIVAVFLFSSAGFCDVANSADDDGQHCVSCCNTCCYSSVLPSQQTTIAPSLSHEIAPIETVLRQEIVVRDIEYPPKSII